MKLAMKNHASVKIITRLWRVDGHQQYYNSIIFQPFETKSCGVAHTFHKNL